MRSAAKHRSEAQPAARRPERSEGHAQKNLLNLCLYLFNSAKFILFLHCVIKKFTSSRF
ncbi:MAG: hypothetical protein RML94_16570 [Bacteroidia bacterium]|nr:hypothetical protein [Bacteroidia bacterium]